MKYNWQQKDWPHFKYKTEEIEDILHEYVKLSNRDIGIISALPKDYHDALVVDFVASEAVKTSAIEGERISRTDVISSVRKNLGLGETPFVRDPRAKGISEMLIHNRNNFDAPLSHELLYDWHSMLFNSSRASIDTIGAYRTHTEPMQIISYGRNMVVDEVHFEAPPSKNVPSEMNSFIDWFNKTAPEMKDEIKHAPIRAAIAHLYFECVHPFEDGNGRVGRAIAEKALSQGLGHSVTLSLSETIGKNRKSYYAALESANKSNEISSWVAYFAQLCLDTQKDAHRKILITLEKVKMFDTFASELNSRQTKTLLRLFDKALEGEEASISANKHKKLNDTSKPTASRDMIDLLKKGIVKQTGGGKYTAYALNIENHNIT